MRLIAVPSARNIVARQAGINRNILLTQQPHSFRAMCRRYPVADAFRLARVNRVLHAVRTSRLAGMDRSAETSLARSRKCGPEVAGGKVVLIATQAHSDDSEMAAA